MKYCINNPAHIKRLVALNDLQPNFLVRILSAHLQAAIIDKPQIYAIIKAMTYTQSACSLALFFNRNQQLRELYYNFQAIDKAQAPEPHFKPHNTLSISGHGVDFKSKLKPSEELAKYNQLTTKAYSSPNGATFCGSPPSDATHKQRSEYARQHGSTHIGSRFVPKREAPKKTFSNI